ncbi:MAG TPA: GNAT family N-acetyltransferase [Candidatus Bathyarchaeia archaeon]|nr:GNAT family N-acetyltransferase [Candidatus Bathyarchaeia archaeon]
MNQILLMSFFFNKRMLIELEEKDFKKALSVISEIEFNNSVNAIIELTHKGRIWVDSFNKPKIALFWDTERRFYLVGDFTNKQINDDLRFLFENTIFPSGLSQRLTQWTFYFAPFEWEQVLLDLLKENHPLTDYRLYYLFDRKRCSLQPNWSEGIPEEYQLELIDQVFLETKSNYENYNEIISEIAYWKSLDKFMEEGYGYCITTDEKIVSWCLGEYVSPKQKRIEVGIETYEPYQHKGFAFKTGSAFVNHSLTKKYSVGWHCWESNIPSVKTAEKIGYQLIQKYPTLFGWYNRIDNLLVNIVRFLQTNTNYQKVIEFGEEIITTYLKNQDIITTSYLFHDINVTYIQLAGANAQLGQIEKGLEWIRKATSNGYKDFDTLQRSPLLAPLRTNSKWQEAMYNK